MKIAIVIGEESGDQLGAALVDALREKRPDIEFFGVTGRRLTARGVNSIIPLDDVAVMGISAVLARLPTIWRRVHDVTEKVVGERPDALVIIDSPGFTHSVAKRVAKRLPNLPIIDYVSPSVWAWRPGRARRMRVFIDHVLALLPFEPDAHQRLGGPPCTYVGHPLIEKLGVLRPAEGERPAIEGDPATLVVLPGSRRSETSRLLPLFGETLRLLQERRELGEVLLPAVEHLHDAIAEGVRRWPVQPTIVTGEAEKFSALRRSHAALAASGTVTLELALAGVPMVVAYKLDPLAKLAKPLIDVPSIVLANLVLGESVVPEFIDADATPERLAGALAPLLGPSPERMQQERAFSRLDGIMRTQERPSERSAGIVLELAGRG